MDKLPLAICLVIPPHALVARAIWPQLSAVAISQYAIHPLTSVGRSVLHRYWSLGDPAVLVDLFLLIQGATLVPSLSMAPIPALKVVVVPIDHVLFVERLPDPILAILNSIVLPIAVPRTISHFTQFINYN